tara:strand:+ start:109 stop:630 length:522 start_codon:yes stop_codon:yes gene_type:complete
MAKKKGYRPKGPIQILAAIGLVIAILWTAKGLFEFGSAGYKEVTNSKSNTKTKTETETDTVVNLNCRWLNGETYLSDGSKLPITSGMPGTHDIAISLMPSKRYIINFEGFGGHQADIKTFSQNEIVWEFDDPSATWDYRLSRMSGSLKTGFIQKSTGGRIFNSYQCSQSQQKF